MAERDAGAHGKSLNASAPQPLRAILEWLDKLSRLDGWIGAACLASLTALMLAEVFVRAVSNVIPAVPASIPVAWEWSSYLMAATFTFGAAMTLRAGGHIRVSLLLANAPPSLRRLLDVASAAVALVFMAFLAYAMVKFTYASYEKGQAYERDDAERAAARFRAAGLAGRPTTRPAPPPPAAGQGGE